MSLTHLKSRLARSIVTVLALGFIQTGISGPAAYAAPPVEPTISSVTADATSLTVSMATTGISASSWRYIITRRSTSGCAAASAGDGVVQSTASLVSSFTVTGLTSGCYYSVKVAGFNGVIGDYAEVDKLVGGYSAVLNVVYQNDAGTGTGIVRTPFTTGCASGTLSNINYSFATGPIGCSATYWTGYISGYIKAPYTGTVTFKMATDDAGVLAIQGNAIAFVTANTVATGTFNMVTGQIYRFEEWFHNDGGGAGNYVYWSYSGQAEQIIPAGNFANDPSVLAADGGCTIGMAARCAAGNALEIKQATGTNTDGQYWIVMNGTATLVYCIMNSSQGGGGWMLAMRGKNSASTFQYNSSYWTDTTLLNNAYPDRFDTTDTMRNVDAKYAPFSYATGNQVMVLYPEVNTNAGGAFGTNGSANPTGINGGKYGFAWHETFTAGSVWTAYNSTTRWGGDSYNYAHTGGPSATSSCVNSPSTLTFLFSNANRCAFRQVQSNYNSAESPYSAVGNNVFFSQTDIRFFGINYGNSNNTFITKSRIGFGWNENGGGIENSSDGNGGIGMYSSASTSIAAGTFNGCCSGTNNLNPGQTGLSGGDNTTKQLGFELYIRNGASATVAGRNLRVTFKRNSSLTAGSGYFASGTNGTNSFRINPLREGFSMDPSNGVITVSENVGIGTYNETVTVTDTAGVSAFQSITIQVVADSSETDTALSFDGTQALSTAGTVGLWADQTWEAWVKPTTVCSQGTNATALGSTSFVLFCNASDWYISFKDSSGSWNGYKTSQRVVANEWVHFAVVRSGSTFTMFVNNRQVNFLVSSSWVSSYSQSVYQVFTAVWVGGTGGAGQYFTGQVDEVKIWSEARTLSQIWSGAHTAENIGSFGLLMYWDFNEGSGSAISRGQRASDSFNLTPLNVNQWTSVATTTNSGPYTVVSVPRTLINKIGGWRAPDSVTAITALVLGGGGGGGGGYQGGGGGAGGFLENTFAIDPQNVYPIKVGIGGRGATNPSFPTNGDTSTAFGYNAIGGGSGESEMIIASVNAQQAATSGGSGGGGAHGSSRVGGLGVAGQGSAGAYGTDLAPTCSQYDGGGGGGAGSTGFTALCTDGAIGTHGGYGGSAKLSAVLGTLVGGGGGGSARLANTINMRGLGSNGAVANGGNSGYTAAALVGATGGATNGSPNTGTGGGAGMSTDGVTGYGGDGGSGIVTFRWITALKPTFTKPANAYLNVGMTETFTTNVAQDSATAVLTRTFRWESSTTSETGTYSLIKSGTGAANASFSWTPTDTTTTGNKFVFRVIVTDSDTAGLFIVDTSTAVFATINRALVLSGKNTVTKTVGVSKSETLTVMLGTPTYSYTFTNNTPLITLDTTTVGSPRIRLADTLTAGTYYDTITVIDSVSAIVVQPLTIVVSPPPSFSANGAQVDSGTVLYLDAGNRASYPRTGATWSDLSGRGLASTFPPITAPAMNGVTTLACNAPTYSSDNLGTLVFNGTSSCGYTPNVGLLKVYSYEVWVKRNGTMTDYSSVIANPWSGAAFQQISITLHWMANGTIQAGIFDGGSWSNVANSPVINVGVWTHVAVTFSGTTLTMTLNGNTAGKISVARTVTWVDAKNDTGILIGKRFDLNADYFNGAIGSVRIYNRVLSDAEMLQNYNATKGRFELTQNKASVSGKYGTTINETYTVTAGSESITAAFTSNAVAGIIWDTTTARSLRVQLQPALAAGTYLDTITVTDIYGSSTNFPLKFTVAKADTFTVFIDTPTALNYTGAQANFTPLVKVTGLVSNDTGTAVSAITYRPGGLTCATGGTCAIGDIGPGGGVVFITPSTAGGNGKYFEAAPANWAGMDDSSSVAKFCTASSNQDGISRGATQVGIGWGDTNTAIFDPYCTGGAIRAVSDYAGGGYTDWFMPSTNELTELAKVRNQAGLLQLGSTWTTGTYGYWGSNETSGSAVASIVTVNGAWNIGATSKSDSVHNMVRPVRQFTACWTTDSCTAQSSSNKPIQAGGYAITPSGFIFTSGLLANYETVTYSTTFVTINRIAQSTQAIPFYSPTFPETMTVYTGGGSGTGAQIFSVIGGGSATGCAFDFRKLSITTAGSCNVQVVKAGDRNYLADTATAMIYQITFVLNQPTGVVGSGATIALNGATSIFVDPNAAPSISSITFWPISCMNGGGSMICSPQYWMISGAGFGPAFNTQTVVKFWRNKVAPLRADSADNYVVNDTTIYIYTIPADATAGRIAVITANGTAVSVDSWRP